MHLPRQDDEPMVKTVILRHDTEAKRDAIHSVRQRKAKVCVGV